MKLRAVAVAVVCCAGVLFGSWQPSAFGATDLTQAGSGAGQTNVPRGLAVDFASGALYVADTGNNRVDVLDSATGAFEFAFGWGVATGAAEFQTCTTVCLAGITGSGAGQFSKPPSIAVDNDPSSPSYHDVYVSDPGNFRVQKFTPSGEFLIMFGGGVDKTTGGDVCTAASGHLCGAGSKGSGSGEFFRVGEQTPMPLGVGAGGTVYVGDSFFTNDPDPVEEVRVQSFDSSGSFDSSFDLGTGRIAELAADSVGAFYVKTQAPGVLAKYSPTGAQINQIDQEETRALAIDPSDILLNTETEYTGQGPHPVIALHDPAGNLLSRFGYGEIDLPNGMVATSSRIYVSDDGIVRSLPYPSLGPIVASGPCSAEPIGNTKATLVALVNPEGHATTTHFQYVDQHSFETEGGFTGPNTVTTAESGSVGSDFSLHEAGAEVDVLPETEYRCRAIATDSEAHVTTGPDGTFVTRPAFEVIGTWATQVGLDHATLNAAVKPLGIAAHGYFEYVADESFQVSGFADAQRAPLNEDIDFGSDPTATADGSAQISGLSTGTRYHYRVVVIDSFFPLGLPGPIKTLHTFGASAEGVDGRAYELVSAGEKNGADVGTPGAAAGLYENEGKARITASSPDGERMTFTSFTSFGDDPAGAPSSSQYLSQRTPAGWTTQNINLPGTRLSPTKPSFTGFTPNLGFGAVVVDEPPVTDEAVPGFENLYLRDSATGQIHTITTEAPQVAAGETFCTGFAGATPDGKHVIFAANGALAGAAKVKAKVKGFRLYEWTEGVGVSLVSVLPGETPAPPSIDPRPAAFGAPGREGCGVDQKFVRNAISTDGQRIFWTYIDSSEQINLMVRIGGTETVQVDAALPGAPGPSGGGRFWSASPDGDKVLFVDQNQLTPGSGSNDLYRYDVSSRQLEDLTPYPPGAAVAGLLGASEDASYAYFIAQSALTGAQNQEGQKAQDGKPNLYLYHDGEPLRFIGTLLPGDQQDWSNEPEYHTSRVSTDGRHLAFVSREALTGYDNNRQGSGGCQLDVGLERNLLGDPRCAEAFIYDAGASAGTGTLVCASCNPSGGRPEGPTLLPAWSNPYEPPRYLSEDGRRLFFETLDALSPRDENQRYDVYEFELLGQGSCEEESPSFVAEESGCIFLISSGRDPGDSYLLDASADGRDVFFSTRERLLPGRDQDNRYDIYDFRVGGGFAELSEPPACQGESCRVDAPAQPPAAVPPSSTFTGPGNLPAKKHKRHKHRKHCKKHKGAKHCKHHKGKKGRAAR
jgi:DNA-binding beta-propeller fold protein YncE